MDEARTVNAWVIAGASLYWASVVTRFSLLKELIPSDRGLQGALAECLFICLFVGVLWCVRRFLKLEEGRTALAVVSLLAMAIVAAVSVWFGETALARLLTPVCYGCSVAVHMVLWGFCFASMDKREAGRNVGLTLLTTVGLVLLADMGMGAVPGVWLVCAMSMASSGVLMSRRVCFSNRRRDGLGGMPLLLKKLAAPRFAFGAFIGLGLSLPFRLGPGDMSFSLALIGLLMVGLMLGGFVRSPGRLYFMLPAVLAMGTGLTYLPFFDGGFGAFIATAVAPVWLAWASLSAIQLSDYKELCGVSEVDVCLADKLLLALAIVGSSGLSLAFCGTGLLDARWFHRVVFAAGALLVFMAVWQTASLVDARKQDEARDRLAATRQLRLAALYDALVAEYGLSAREREVMEMLAEGYTSAYIKDALGMSLGTAKAHASHIYQKTGVHKKDELIELIERRLSQV